MALKINKQTWVQMKVQNANQGMNIPKSPNGYNQNKNHISGSAF